jgi:hypothetical protein
MALTTGRLVGLEVITIQILSQGKGRMSDECEIQDDTYLTRQWANGRLAEAITCWILVVYILSYSFIPEGECSL